MSSSQNDTLTRNPTLCNTISGHPNASSLECKEKWEEREIRINMVPIRGGKEGEKDAVATAAEPSQENEDDNTFSQAANHPPPPV